MWDKQEQDERKQLNHVNHMDMFGKPIDAPKNSIILRTHLKMLSIKMGLVELRSAAMAPKELLLY